jgi:uncharacterized protein (TIGR03083 family)
MESGWVPTKEELLRGLADGGEALRRVCDRLDGAGWQAGRYEGGWNARQLLAHIASAEWTYPRLLDLARAARAGEGPGTASARAGIDAYNARQVERRANASVEELVAEFERNRAATIRAVEEAEDELWGVEIQSAGGFRGPLALVLWLTAVNHVRVHTEDLAGGPAA